nr:integrase, catalytic region, zinc finger, CCHC-type, peptidase aspartic, catalytic [Tanacetum cinerariifolium]
MLLAIKTEAGGAFNDEENDFMLDNAYGDETLKELTAAVIMIARIQLADDSATTEPKYDAEAVRKNVNTKFDKSETLGKLLYVTPLNTNTAVKAKKLSNTETYAYGDVRSQNQDLLTISELNDKIKTIEKGKNVNTKFDKYETLGKLLYVTPLNTNTAVKAKKLSNTEKFSSSDSKVSNKGESMNSTVYQSNANVLKANTVNTVNDDSRVKKALFICPIAAKPRNLGATSVVVKSNGCSMTGNLQLLRNFIEKFMGTVRFRNDHFTEITGCGYYVQEDLDNFVSPLYKEYCAMSTPKVSDDFAADTLHNEDTPSSSSIVVEENEAPQILTSSEEPIANEPTTRVSNENANELVQEDVAAFDENEFYNPFHTPVFEEAGSSQDPSNMHEFYQKHCSTDL